MAHARSSAVGVAALAALGIVATALWFAAPPVIDAAYHGRSIGLLNGVISGQQRHSVADYVVLFRRTLFSMSVAAGILTALWLFSRQLGARVQGLSRQSRALLLIGFILLVAAGRVFTYGEAYERDITAYAVISEEMLRGKALYTEVWDHKPPAIHLSYAASLAVFGETPLAIWVLGCTAAAITLLGCYRAGCNIGGPVAGVIAAGVWVLVNGDLLLQANQPNTEVFMNVCLVWGFALFTDPRRGTGRAAIAGLLFFLAALYKPVVAVVAVLVSIAHVLASAGGASDRDGQPTAPWRGVSQTLVAGGVAALAGGAVCAFFMARGMWPQFLEATVAYNRDYAGSVTSNLASSLLPGSHPLWATLPYLAMVGVLGLVLIGWMFRPDSQAKALYLVAYLAGAWLAIVMPGRLYPHYYQLLLPPAAVAFGWLAAVLLQTRSTALAIALGACLLGPLAGRAYQMLVPLSEVPIFKYGAHGVESLEVQRIGEWIKLRVPPSAVLYHWGAEPGVYFWSGRPSPVAFTYNLPLLDDNERGRRYSAQTLATLEQHPPDLIVAKRLDLHRVGHPITQWIQTRYEPTVGPTGITQYVLLVPRMPSHIMSDLASYQRRQVPE